MKFYVLLTALSLLSVSAYCQNLSHVELDTLTEQAKADLLNKFTDDPKIRDVKLLDVQIKTNLKNTNQKSIYFTWGYNWTRFTNADLTLSTPDGTFTIKNAHGNDRPSPDPKTYINIEQLSIPQYNVRLGYRLELGNGKSALSAEIGQEHMKWVFDNTRKYDFEGNYDRNVFVQPQKMVDFNYVKTHHDATWLTMVEHTNGLNYVHLSGKYTRYLYSNPKSTIKLMVTAGLGAGLLVPKTEFHAQVEDPANPGQPTNLGIDNRFHVAGWGANADVEGEARFFNIVSIGSALQGNYIKINNALVDGSQGNRLSQKGINALQTIPLYLKISVPITRKRK